MALNKIIAIIGGSVGLLTIGLGTFNLLNSIENKNLYEKQLGEQKALVGTILTMICILIGIF